MTRINKLVLLLLLVPFGFVSMAHAASDVVSQTPVNGALGVAATSAVTVVFDRDITATTTNISFSPSVAFTFATSSNTLTITPSASLSNNTTYTLTLAGIKDVNGNVLSSYTSQFTTQNNYSVPVYNNTNGGLNLVSLPVQPSSTAIASVLGTAANSISSVWSYDPSNPLANSSGWLVYYPAHPELSNLTTMNTGYGYWITANADATLSGVGSLFTSTSTPPSRTVQSGWNLLGYYQLPGQSNTDAAHAFSTISSYTTVVGYDNQTGSFKAVSSIVPGDAFWLGIPSSGTYYPSYSFSSGNGSATFGSAGSPPSVSVSKDPASPSAKVAVGATNVKWASFDMLAPGENVKVTDLYVYATSAGVGGLRNGKVFMNGVQIGSTKNIGANSGSSTDFALGSSLVLPAGQTAAVDIYADAQDTAGTNFTNNSTIVVTLAAGTNNAQGQSSLLSTNVPATNTSGNTITIGASSLTAAKYSGYGNQTMLAGTNNAKLGAFTLSTGSLEGITVNTINITFPSAVSATITNLTLKDDATGATLGVVITTPSTDNSYSVSLDIPASSSKTIDIYGNILSGASAGTIQSTVTSLTTGTGDITGTSVSVGSVALQTVTLGTASLSVTRGAGDPVSNNVLAGASSIMVGEFNFTSQNSAYTVQNLAVLIPNNAATSVTSVTVAYKDVNGATQTTTQALAVNASMAYATATFTGLTMYVPANDSANLDVYVGTPTIAAGATSGATINVALDTGATSGTFRAVNSAGSALTIVDSGVNQSAGGTFYVRKSIPTFAMQSTGVTVPTTGSPIYKFTVTADPAGAIEWTHLAFNLATSSAMLTNLYLTDDSTGMSLTDSGVYATTTSTTAVFDLTTNSTQAKYAQVAAGASKTYDLYGTVSGFVTGSTITISLAGDGSATTNGTATDKASGDSVVWSDRSAAGQPSHSITSSDWTNGYLLKNFTSNVMSYSK